MSFYRTLIAAVAAVVIAAPVFADDTANATPSTSAAAVAQPATADATNAATTAQPTTVADQQAAAAATETKININKATSKDLMKIKGISSSKAKAIVAYRKKHGGFKTLDDLANVKGFKKMSSDQIKAVEDQLTIE